MDLEQFRLQVAAASARLSSGEKPAEVPCPKCGQDRYLTIELLGKLPMAVCSCCGFHWMT